MKKLFLVSLLVSMLSPALVSAGESGSELLKQRCASCHDLKGPAPQTIKELWKRDAPDLFYAGNKFQRDWLVEWLQKPVRIRPGGVNYLRHINSTPPKDQKTKSGRKFDVLWGQVLKPLNHVKLSKQQAELAADALMEMTPNYSLNANVALDPSITTTLDDGEVLFDKVHGCLSCHQIEPNYGGYTGAEVYTAGKRLQPEYMLSFIRHPKDWDPKIWMPGFPEMTESDLQKLVQYMILLSKEDFNATN